MACVIKRAHDIGSGVGLSRSLERKRSAWRSVPALQFAAWELQDIIQFVVVKVKWS
jgi:hypothetical protein